MVSALCVALVVVAENKKEKLAEVFLVNVQLMIFVLSFLTFHLKWSCL